MSFNVHFGAQVIAVRKTHYKLGEKAACSTVTQHLMFGRGFHWSHVALPEDKNHIFTSMREEGCSGPRKYPQATGSLSPAVSPRLWKALLSLFFKDLNLSFSLCPPRKTDEHYSHVSAFKSASCLTDFLVPRLAWWNDTPWKSASIKII